VFADADPRWSRLPEAMNGVTNSRQTTLVADIFFTPVPRQFLFAGTIVFAKVCFLITFVPWLACRRCEEWNLFMNNSIHFQGTHLAETAP